MPSYKEQRRNVSINLMPSQKTQTLRFEEQENRLLTLNVTREIAENKLTKNLSKSRYEYHMKTLEKQWEELREHQIELLAYESIYTDKDFTEEVAEFCNIGRKVYELIERLELKAKVSPAGITADDMQLEIFWSTEEDSPAQQIPLSKEKVQCEDHHVNTIKREDNGTITVENPIKIPESDLETSETDSMIILAGIEADPAAWNTVVENRATELNRSIPAENQHNAETSENPGETISSDGYALDTDLEGKETMQPAVAIKTDNSKIIDLFSKLPNGRFGRGRLHEPLILAHVEEFISGTPETTQSKLNIVPDAIENDIDRELKITSWNVMHHHFMIPSTLTTAIRLTVVGISVFVYKHYGSHFCKVRTPPKAESKYQVHAKKKIRWNLSRYSPPRSVVTSSPGRMFIPEQIQ